MKKEQLTQLLCAATICVVAIACHAQDTTTLQQASFEELVDHPLFVEYREINQQRYDLTTYGLIDMKEISKVFKENYDPCDIANQLKVQHIENGEKYLDLMCQTAAQHAKIMAEYPYVLDFTPEQRIELMFKVEPLGHQDVEQLKDLQENRKPDQ